MGHEHITCGTDGPVCTITLNRPEKMNAFTERMKNEIIEALDEADANDAVRAVIVTGAGRAFCAGADLEAGMKTFDYRARENQQALSARRDGGGMVTLRIFEMRKPVIAAVNGSAVGVGLTMTLPMDFRIIAAEAKLGFVFTRRGIVPEACSTWFLPRLVGIAQALDWVTTGRIFTPAEALERGLATRVLPRDGVMPAARELALEIADNTSAMSVALARRMLWSGSAASHPMQAHRLETRNLFFMGASPDAAEGVMSFLQKRPPRFTMGPAKDMPPFYPWGVETWEE